MVIARLTLGGILFYYGYPKLKRVNTTAESFSRRSLKPGKWWAAMAALLETFGGLMVALGVFTQAVALLVAFEMTIAVLWKLKEGKPFAEYAVPLALFALALLIAGFGSGAYALI